MDELDKILNKRVVPEASANLADRIIARAQSPQKPKRAFDPLKWMESYFLRPAYALAFLFAIVLGATLYLNTSSPQPRVVTVEINDDIDTYIVYDMFDVADLS